MDLVAEMLLHEWRNALAGEVEATDLELPIAPVARRFPPLAERRAALNFDRLVARFVSYPAAAGWQAARAQRTLSAREEGIRGGRWTAGARAAAYYHVADHSYAQLVHVLPASRTGVYCHDLDAFRSLVEPERDRRPPWFRALARIVLRGMQAAAVVFHSTRAVGDEILRLGLVEPRRLVHAPYGVSPEFDAVPRAADGDALSAEALAPFVLHVGNALPRKRLDVLFDTFARLLPRHPVLRLVQQGAALSDAQREHARAAGIESRLVQPPKLTRAALAGLYRRAAVVLVPSDSEGFGFPVIEALASGAVVIASDIAVLREVGGDAAVYCPPGDPDAWAQTVSAILRGEREAPPRATRLAQAARFTWRRHAETLLGAYRQLDAERAR